MPAWFVTQVDRRARLLVGGGILVEGTPSRVLSDAHVVASYGVNIGEHDGVPFLLPWTPSGKALD